MSNGSLLAIQGHLWCYFKGNLLQFGMDDVIFLQIYLVTVKNSFLLAESQRQRRFWRKPHIKSSFRSGGVVTWLHKQTNKQTDILILLIYRG